MHTDPRMSKAYEDLGRRLASAYTSWHMGYKGVDHIMRKYEAQPVNESWAELGRQLHNMVLPIDKEPEPTQRLMLVK
jgi:hypothetical protein